MAGAAEPLLAKDSKAAQKRVRPAVSVLTQDVPLVGDVAASPTIYRTIYVGVSIRIALTLRCHRRIPLGSNLGWQRRDWRKAKKRFSDSRFRANPEIGAKRYQAGEQECEKGMDFDKPGAKVCQSVARRRGVCARRKLRRHSDFPRGGSFCYPRH